MMTHFVEGLPDGTLSNYDFTYRGIPYHVAAAVQYKTNPNHFVAWIRNAKGKQLTRKPLETRRCVDMWWSTLWMLMDRC